MRIDPHTRSVLGYLVTCFVAIAALTFVLPACDVEDDPDAPADEEAPAEEDPGTPPAAPAKNVEGLVINGLFVPNCRVPPRSAPDACPQLHFHGPITGFNGDLVQTKADPDEFGCGHGEFPDPLNLETRSISPAAQKNWTNRVGDNCFDETNVINMTVIPAGTSPTAVCDDDIDPGTECGDPLCVSGFENTSGEDLDCTVELSGSPQFELSGTGCSNGTCQDSVAPGGTYTITVSSSACQADSVGAVLATCTGASSGSVNTAFFETSFRCSGVDCGVPNDVYVTTDPDDCDFAYVYSDPSVDCPLNICDFDVLNDTGTAIDYTCASANLLVIPTNMTAVPPSQCLGTLAADAILQGEVVWDCGVSTSNVSSTYRIDWNATGDPTAGIGFFEQNVTVTCTGVSCDP